MTAADRVKTTAREIGFTKVGIARVEPLEKETRRLREWLARGFHASMDWMERNEAKRTDVTLVVPGAKSVIALAINYYTGTQHDTRVGAGKISRYAWGDDYHEVVGKKLARLWEWMLQEFPGIDGRYYVDTGPVMDKVWAERAGIGWIGKHSNLITQDYGSWVFLSELITTLELEHDETGTDHCGTCTLCIEACPTDAIVNPYVVDSHKCISYHTIEHRGPINGDAVNKLDGWIYGCDICQDVCPWNERFSQETKERGFQPREGNTVPKLEEWSTMSEEEFRRRFQRSPMKRAKREGLVRNVNIALEHSADGRGR